VNVAESESSNKKRQVRDPETFRERAIKATAESEKPTRSHTIRRAPGRILRPVTSPTGRFLRRLFSVQPFKTVGWIGVWIGRILVPRYVRNSWRELKLVTWPDWKQSRQLTFAVLAFAIVFGAVIALVDYGLDKVFKQILLK
jgi:preprotein translocase SecE subunit